MSLIRQVLRLNEVPDREDRELIKDLDRLFDQAKNDRMQYEGQWLLNMAFFLAQQWVVFDSLTRRLRQIRSVDDKQVRMVVNFVRQQVLTKYAKLTQTTPESHAQPASDDVDDRYQAEVCDAILEYLRTIDGTDGAEMRAMLWAVVTGTGIFKTCWDKSAGSPLYYPDTTVVHSTDEGGQDLVSEIPHPRAGQPLIDKNGDQVFTGEIETTEVSPFEFFPDPFGLTMAKKNWVFIQTLRSPEYILERFGVQVEAHDQNGDGFMDGQLASLMTGSTQPKQGVPLREFWQRTTKQYPEGRYVVYVDGRVLFNGPNPYPKAQLPFSAFVDNPVPGRFWGDSIVTDMIDPQRNLNKGRSQIIEIRNALKPKITAAAGVLKPTQDITNSPRDIIEYEAKPDVADGGRPTILQGGQVPDGMWKDAELSKSELREVSGLHEVSAAQTPGGVGAFRAIAALQEQDDLRLGPTAKEYERAIGERDEFKLRLGRQFYEEPRTARIVGPNNAVKVVQFYKDDIPDDIDVKVVAGSSLPKSRVARQNFLMELWKMPIFQQDPKAANEFLRLMEMGDIKGLFEEANLDTSQAERENERLKAGDQFPANDFDAHSVHVATHNKFRKTEEYEHLDPSAQSAFEQHVQTHRAAAAAQPAVALGQPQPPSQPTSGEPNPAPAGPDAAAALGQALAAAHSQTGAARTPVPAPVQLTQ
jgi:hypothetical protein